MNIDKEELLKDTKVYNNNLIESIFQFFISSQKDLEYGDKAKQIYKELKWCEPITFDVINSFWTIFSFAMHSKFPNLYPVAEAGNVKIYKNHYYKYDSFPEKYFREKSNEIRMVDELCKEYPFINKLAAFCHSIANFMPCPYGFNQAKGCLADVRDYFPLMINKIQKCIDDNVGFTYTSKKGQYVVNIEKIKYWHQWFRENRDKYCLSMYYKIDNHKLIGIKFFDKQSFEYPCPKEPEEIKKCLESMVESIEVRAEKIFEQYKMQKSNNV